MKDVCYVWLLVIINSTNFCGKPNCTYTLKGKKNLKSERRDFINNKFTEVHCYIFIIKAVCLAFLWQPKHKKFTLTGIQHEGPRRAPLHIIMVVTQTIK